MSSLFLLHLWWLPTPEIQPPPQIYPILNFECLFCSLNQKICLKLGSIRTVWTRPGARMVQNLSQLNLNLVFELLSVRRNELALSSVHEWKSRHWCATRCYFDKFEQNIFSSEAVCSQQGSRSWMSFVYTQWKNKTRICWRLCSHMWDLVKINFTLSVFYTTIKDHVIVRTHILMLWWTRLFFFFSAAAKVYFPWREASLWFLHRGACRTVSPSKQLSQHTAAFMLGPKQLITSHFFLGDCSRLFWAVIRIRQLREVTGRHAERRHKASHPLAACDSLHVASFGRAEVSTQIPVLCQFVH